jgi:hypothetical protein
MQDMMNNPMMQNMMNNMMQQQHYQQQAQQQPQMNPNMMNNPMMQNMMNSMMPMMKNMMKGMFANNPKAQEMMDHPEVEAIYTEAMQKMMQNPFQMMNMMMQDPEGAKEYMRPYRDRIQALMEKTQPLNKLNEKEKNERDEIMIKMSERTLANSQIEQDGVIGMSEKMNDEEQALYEYLFPKGNTVDLGLLQSRETGKRMKMWKLIQNLSQYIRINGNENPFASIDKKESLINELRKKYVLDTDEDVENVKRLYEFLYWSDDRDPIIDEDVLILGMQSRPDLNFQIKSIVGKEEREAAMRYSIEKTTAIRPKKNHTRNDLIAITQNKMYPITDLVAKHGNKLPEIYKTNNEKVDVVIDEYKFENAFWKCSMETQTCDIFVDHKPASKMNSENLIFLDKNVEYIVDEEFEAPIQEYFEEDSKFVKDNIIPEGTTLVVSSFANKFTFGNKFMIMEIIDDKNQNVRKFAWLQAKDIQYLNAESGLPDHIDQLHYHVMVKETKLALASCDKKFGKCEVIIDNKPAIQMDSINLIFLNKKRYYTVEKEFDADTCLEFAFVKEGTMFTFPPESKYDKNESFDSDEILNDTNYTAITAATTTDNVTIGTDEYGQRLSSIDISNEILNDTNYTPDRVIIGKDNYGQEFYFNDLNSIELIAKKKSTGKKRVGKLTEDLLLTLANTDCHKIPKGAKIAISTVEENSIKATVFDDNHGSNTKMVSLTAEQIQYLDAEEEKIHPSILHEDDLEQGEYVLLYFIYETNSIYETLYNKKVGRIAEKCVSKSDSYCKVHIDDKKPIEVNRMNLIPIDNIVKEANNWKTMEEWLASKN